MPRYSYRCEDCGGVFETHHSMSEDLEVCAICTATGSLSRLPSAFTTTSPSGGSGEQPVGVAVREFIENSKEDLKAEKERIKKEEYK
jgi:putative FmdB family regulatory protein